MFKSLRGKLVITFLVLIFVAMLFIGIFLLNTLENYYLNNLADNLKREAELMAVVLPDSTFAEGRTDQLNSFCQLWAAKLNNRVTIIALDGTVLADSHEPAGQMENHRQREEVGAALKNGYGQSIRYSSSLNTQMMYLAVPVRSTDNLVLGIVRFAVPLQDVQENLSRLWSIFTSLILISTIITGVLGFKLASGIIRPLEEMTEMAQEIAQGNFGQSLPVHTDDEVGKLGSALQKMSNDLKQKVTELSDEKSKFEAVLANVLSGIVLVDQDKQVVLINPAAARIFNLNSIRILAKPLTALTHNYQLDNWLEEVQKDGRPRKKELVIYSPGEKILEVNLLPMRLQNGQLAGVLLVFYDLTEIRRLERVRQDFVANVSHELRTPLTAIKGLSETLLDGALEDEEVRVQFVETILKESERLNRLVSDLLSLTRIEAGKEERNREFFDLGNTARQTVEELGYQFKELGIHLTLKVPDGPVLFRGNEDELKQIFLNLLENAAKYSKPNGLVKFSLEEDKESVRILVRDEGIGIPQEDLPRIFERFYRVDKARSRKRGGTGLGLAIVKHLVESYEGKIRVESKLGEGSAFFVSLPK